MLKSFLFDALKKNIVEWLKKNGRDLIMQMLDQFLKNLAEAQGAPSNSAHLTGPEVEAAKQKTLDDLLS